MPVLKTRQKLTRVMIFLTDSALTTSKREVLHLSPGPLAPLPSEMLPLGASEEQLPGVPSPWAVLKCPVLSVLEHREASWDITGHWGAGHPLRPPAADLKFGWASSFAGT